MKKTFQLTNQRGAEGIELEVNPAGQVRIGELIDRGIARDSDQACELLGVAPADVRYGLATVRDPWEALFGPPANS